jgi:mannose-6-phosphate isomerase-like protein (cupin superfamily)
MMRHFWIAPALLLAAALPVSAAAPAIVFTQADARAALAGNHAKGFAMQNLHAADQPGAHVSTATLRRDQSEKSGLSHDHVTEIYQILDGEAVLTTGGSFPDGGKAMTSDVDPAIGPSHQGVIQGGKPAPLKVGDIVIMPPGTPHQFSRIDDHVTYMVIRFSTEKY